MGTVYKMQDYLAALIPSTANSATSATNMLMAGGMITDFTYPVLAISLSTIEFMLGVFMLFGIHRRFTTKMILIFMIIFTIITAWVWAANPVKDCGCFGDAIVLTNAQTFIKNIVLLLMAVVVARYHQDIIRLITERHQWVIVNLALLFVIAISGWALYDLPLIDFRPYHVGADFRTDMDIPEGEKQPQFETTFILEKDGKQQEFTIDNYPDSTWTFIDSKTIQTEEGYIPPIHDFTIEDTATGNDLTDSIAKRDGYTMLLISPNIREASDANFGDIDAIYEHAIENNYLFCMLTAGNEKAITDWRHKTGAEYQIYFTDQTTLKTIIRSNPGLLMLKDGKIIGKWSHNRLPNIQKIKKITKQKQITKQ